MDHFTRAVFPPNAMLLLGEGRNVPQWYYTGVEFGGTDASVSGGSLGPPTSESIDKPLYRRRTIRLSEDPAFTCDAFAVAPLNRGKLRLRWQDVDGRKRAEDSELSRNSAVANSEHPQVAVSYREFRKRPAFHIKNAVKHHFRYGALIPGVSHAELTRTATKTVAKDNDENAERALQVNVPVSGSVEIRKDKKSESIEVDAAHRNGQAARFKLQRNLQWFSSTQLPSFGSLSLDWKPHGARTMTFSNDTASIKFKAIPQSRTSNDTFSEFRSSNSHDSFSLDSADSHKSPSSSSSGSLLNLIDVEEEISTGIIKILRQRKSHWLFTAAPCLRLPIMSSKLEAGLEPDGGHSIKLTSAKGDRDITVSVTRAADGSENKFPKFRVRAQKTERVTTTAHYGGGLNGGVERTETFHLPLYPGTSKRVNLTVTASVVHERETSASMSLAAKIPWGSGSLQASTDGSVVLALDTDIPVGTLSIECSATSLGKKFPATSLRFARYF